MKFELLVFLFFIFSLSLVWISIEQNAEQIYSEVTEKIHISNIQTSSAKGYKRTRKGYVAERSVFLAKRDIKNILLKDPIHFELNNSSFIGKATLTEIVKIVNHVRGDIVLSILVHTDASGTAEHNLYLSQKRADKLKEYFRNKTNLLLIVAIGYGEVFLLKDRLIEINLKRIKQ